MRRVKLVNWLLGGAMTVEFSLAYFVAVFVFSITPGPGVFALIAKALKQGQQVEFTITEGEKGLQAENVTPT